MEFQTPSGFDIKRVYTHQDINDVTLRQEGEPGKFPFARGLYPQGYQAKLWTMRMYCGYGTAAETNKRFHYLIGHGETGLSLAFDLPTQMGLDPDHPNSKGEVGKVGVSVGGIWDFERLFKGIDLSKVSISMTINATALVLYSCLVVLARRRGLDPKILRGTVQNDILKEYLARGTYAFPPAPSLRLACDLMEYSVKETPLFYPVSVSGYHIREAGATAVDELAFTFGNALVYLDQFKARVGSIKTLLQRLSFFFGVHNHFLEEIAKFRAARKIWAHLVRLRYGIEDPKMLHLRFHAQTCGSTLARQDPFNNAVRVSLQAMAAVLGGAQSLHTNSFDEALAIPTEQAQLLALRTQQILALETGIADTADPVGGSYAIEALTQDIVVSVKDRLEEISRHGGMLEAIKDGFAGQAIAQSSYHYQMAIESGKIPIVGVNTFGGDHDSSGVKAFKVRPLSENQSVRALARHRRQREKKRVERALERLAQVMATQENVVPVAIGAVDAGATLGEIAQALARVAGWQQSQH